MESISFNLGVFIIFFLRVVVGMRILFWGWLLIRKGSFAAQKQLDEEKGPYGNFLSNVLSNSIVDAVFDWLLFISGILLVFGILVRPVSIIMILISLLFWIATAPDKKGIVTEYAVLITSLLMIILVNAGLFWGYDYFMLHIPAVLNLYKTYAWLEWLL